MKDLLNILGCGTVYFLIVYLFVIRRQVRPIIPWASCIGTQVICTVCFYRLVDLCHIVFPEDRFGYFGKFLPSCILLFGNLALIFIMFGPVMNRIKDKNVSPGIEDDDFTVSPLPGAADTPSVNAYAENVPGDGDITMDFIEKTVAEGKRDEAIRYLKMLVLCSKDEKSRSDAARMMEELKRTEAQ